MIIKEYLHQELRRRIEGIKPGVETTTDNIIAEMKSILVLVDALQDRVKDYDDIVQRVKELHDAGNTLTKQQMEIILPQLRESEDERIRKRIKGLIYHNDALLDKDELLAWLEKQKELFESGKGMYYYDGEKTTYCGYPATEENPYDFAMSQQEKQKEQVIDETDKIAAAYQLGRSDERRQKEPEKEELVYRLNGLMQEYINEAKDQEEEEHRFKCYKLFWNALENESYFEQKEQKPMDKHLAVYLASVIARDIDRVMDGMCISNTECVALENAFLNGEYDKISDFLEKKYTANKQEQKPVEWSEFDKGALKDAICATDILGNDEYLNKGNPNLGKAFRVAKDWLRELPERFNLQPKQEWSEEDETYFSIVLDALDCFINGRVCSSMASHDVTEQACDWFKNRIKSLRPSWKPSEEQMTVLSKAIELRDLTEKDGSVLMTLYSDLQKLM